MIADGGQDGTAAVQEEAGTRAAVDLSKVRRFFEWLDGRFHAVARELEWLASGMWRWWIILAVAVALLLTGVSIVGVIGSQLTLMHGPGGDGYGLQRMFGSPNLHMAVPTWEAFWVRLSDQYVEPKQLANWSLLLDSVLLVPGYLFAGLVVLLREHGRHRDDSLGPPLRSAAVFLIAVAILDWIENGLTWWQVRSYWGRLDEQLSGGFPETVLTVVTSAKWLLAFLVILSVVLIVATRLRHRTSETRATTKLMRGQLGVSVAVLALVAPIQVPDVILRMGWEQAFWAAGLTGSLAVITWAASQLIVLAHVGREEPEPGGQRARPRVLLLLASPFLLLAALNMVRGGGALAPLLPLIMALVIIVLGVPLRSLPPPPDDRPCPTLAAGEVRAKIRTGESDDPRALVAMSLPRTLAAATMAVVAAAAVRASVASQIQGDRVRVVVVLAVALAVAALATVYVLYRVDRRLRPQGAIRAYAAILAGAAVVPLASIWWQLMAPDSAPQSVGALGVVISGFAACSLLFGGLVLLSDWWVDHHDVPPAFTTLGFTTVPVFVLLAAWGALAARVDDGGHWDVRLRAGATPPGISVDKAFKDWVARAEVRAGPTGPNGRRTIPLVLVATSGGGIRSAYWTGLALDCVFSGRMAATTEVRSDPCVTGGSRTVSPSDVFLASGISGGSLGLVEWEANMGESPSASWVERRLGGDFISPNLARGLLVEIPRAFLHFKAAGRAEAMEKAWEQSWSEASSPNPMTQGFLSAQERTRSEGGPLLMLNGASVFDGCALNVSLLEAGSTVDQTPTGRSSDGALGECKAVARYDERLRPAAPGTDLPGPLPATVDIVDYLNCQARPGDIRRSTAALLSARFPYVSPAGRLTACDGKSAPKFIVDGGYVDTSAVEAIVGVWHDLEPAIQIYNGRQGATTCVVPYLLQLDNSYIAAASPVGQTKAPNHLLAPPLALWQTTGLQSRASRARAMGAELFTRPFPGGADPLQTGEGLRDRYTLIAPSSHPGLEAPLGWTLAPSSRRDLEKELYRTNGESLTQLRRWLANPPACPTQATR